MFRSIEKIVILLVNYKISQNTGNAVLDRFYFFPKTLMRGKVNDLDCVGKKHTLKNVNN